MKKPAKKRLYIDIGGGESSKFRRLADKNKNPERKFWIIEKSDKSKPAKRKDNLSFSSKGALRTLKKVGDKTVSWVNSDFVVYTKALGRWDSWENSKKIAGEVFRVLKEGGKFTVTVTQEDKDHIRLLLGRQGFEIEKETRVRQRKGKNTHWEETHMQWAEDYRSGFWPYRITAKKPKTI